MKINRFVDVDGTIKMTRGVWGIVCIMHILEVMFFVGVDGTLSDFMRTILVYLFIYYIEVSVFRRAVCAYDFRKNLFSQHFLLLFDMVAEFTSRSVILFCMTRHVRTMHMKKGFIPHSINAHFFS